MGTGYKLHNNFKIEWCAIKVQTFVAYLLVWSLLFMQVCSHCLLVQYYYHQTYSHGWSCPDASLAGMELHLLSDKSLA